METCPQHGGPLADCADIDREWYAHRHVCPASMVLAAEQRKYQDAHKERPFHDGTGSRWAKEASAQYPYHYADGVRWSVDSIPEPSQTDDESGGDVSGDQA